MKLKGDHLKRIDILVLRHREADERVKRMPSLLGRDILNKYILYLNAEEKVIEIRRGVR